jgi:hypothetical protein
MSHLPKISPNIVDETRHEKILSYLCDHSTEFCQVMDLAVLLQCLEHADYRVRCMGLRFLGMPIILCLFDLVKLYAYS